MCYWVNVIYFLDLGDCFYNASMYWNLTAFYEFFLLQKPLVARLNHSNPESVAWWYDTRFLQAWSVAFGIALSTCRPSLEGCTISQWRNIRAVPTALLPRDMTTVIPEVRVQRKLRSDWTKYSQGLLLGCHIWQSQIQNCWEWHRRFRLCNTLVQLCAVIIKRTSSTKATRVRGFQHFGAILGTAATGRKSSL